MREIKFRVYSQKDRKFYHWGFIEDSFVCFPNSAELTIEYCRKNSQEYTGLRDKNKKEIYDGDIIKVYGQEPRIYPYIDRVGWEYDGFYLPVADETTKIEIEIIGNIYENPELLKENKK